MSEWCRKKYIDLLKNLQYPFLIIFAVKNNFGYVNVLRYYHLRLTERSHWTIFFIQTFRNRRYIVLVYIQSRIIFTLWRNTLKSMKHVTKLFDFLNIQLLWVRWVYNLIDHRYFNGYLFTSLLLLLVTGAHIKQNFFIFLKLLL